MPKSPFPTPHDPFAPLKERICSLEKRLAQHELYHDHETNRAIEKYNENRFALPPKQLHHV